MVLRLILVGLVAGLGVSLPGRRDLDTLGRSAQRWVNTRLAEWDAGSSVEEGSYILIREPVIVAPRPQAPPVVSDNAFASVMDETVATFVQTELASRRDAAEPVVAEIVAPESLCTLAIAVPTEPAAPEAEPSRIDLAFDAVMEETVATFAATPEDEPSRIDLAFDAVMEETAATFAADVLASTTRPAADPIALGDWAEDLALLLSREEAPDQEVGPAPPPPLPEVEVAANNTLEFEDDLYAGEAYALNRISDGLNDELADASAAEVEAPRPAENRLTQAVRLTREAVFAWGSLLHGPAVVTTAP